MSDTFRALCAELAQPPADGEVGELVAWLRAFANGERHEGRPATAQSLARAADLLERLASPACLVIDPGYEAVAARMTTRIAGHGRVEAMPAYAQLIEPAERTVPVAVSERLPGAEDCDEQGRCWMFDDQLELPSWTLIRVQGEGLAPDMYWLPANALSTPQGNDI